MKIKELVWTRTSLRHLEYNGRPVTSETWVVRNGLANYTVYSSVGGRCFVILPAYDSGGLPGFRTDGFLDKAKTPCGSVVEGKLMAEHHWQQMIKRITVEA